MAAKNRFPLGMWDIPKAIGTALNNICPFEFSKFHVQNRLYMAVYGAILLNPYDKNILTYE
jgi:hypothetical protein